LGLAVRPGSLCQSDARVRNIALGIGECSTAWGTASDLTLKRARPQVDPLDQVSPLPLGFDYLPLLLGLLSEQRQALDL